MREAGLRIGTDVSNPREGRRWVAAMPLEKAEYSILLPFFLICMNMLLCVKIVIAPGAAHPLAVILQCRVWDVHASLL